MGLGKVITITSGKGGVGKTTTTANLSTALAEIGSKVIVIDFDIGLRNLDTALGLENRVVFDCIQVMDEEVSLKQATVVSKLNRNLSFLAASQSKDKNALEIDKVKKLLNDLKKEYDYIFIDSPAGIEAGFEHSMVLADYAFIVVNPEISSIRDADKIIGLIDSKSEKAKNGEEVIKKLIINRYDIKMVDKKDMVDIEDIHRFLGLDIIGVLPEEKDVIASSNKGEPIFHNKKLDISNAYSRIADRVLDNSTITPSHKVVSELFYDGKIQKIFNKIFRLA